MLQPCRERFAQVSLYPVQTPFMALQEAQGMRYKIRRVLARLRSRILAAMQALAIPLSLADERSNPFGLSSRRMFILNRRFFIAREIIRTLAADTRSVLLSDSRDVVLQADPFLTMGQGCHTGMEYRTHGESPINGQWIRSTYGEDGFEALKDQLVLCSGVTLGSREGVLTYLDCFCAEIAACAVLRRTVLIPIWDQAYHNAILRRSGSPPVTLMPWRSPLATVGEVPTEDLTLEADGSVSIGGLVPAILHQYDRHPEISSAICERQAELADTHNATKH
ncbi:MAG: hypothetical protein ACKO5F_07690 [Synechococcus sp.]